MAYTAITKPTAGNGVSKSTFGDLASDNDAYLYALRSQCIWIPLNGATALTTGDKAYWRVPAKFNGGLLTAVAAACKDGSSSGAVTLLVKNGATSMLSVNILLDQTETDTLTSSQPGTINTAADDLATGNLIEISCSGAGTGVTYCGVELTVTPA
jgi:hypothetical protein